MEEGRVEVETVALRFGQPSLGLVAVLDGAQHAGAGSRGASDQRSDADREGCAAPFKQRQQREGPEENAQRAQTPMLVS